MQNEFEWHLKRCEQIAKVIWNEPFLTGLEKLKNWQLQLVVESLAEKLDANKNIKGQTDNRDIKQIMNDEKKLIIESLYPKFFEEVK